VQAGYAPHAAHVPGFCYAQDSAAVHCRCQSKHQANSLGLEDLLHDVEGMVSRSIVDASGREVREIVKASDIGDHQEKGIESVADSGNCEAAIRKFIPAGSHERENRLVAHDADFLDFGEDPNAKEG
jgi:hypothetical protein